MPPVDPPAPELRRARVQDAPAIADIAARALPEGWSAQAFRDALETRGGVGFVALDEAGALVGYALGAHVHGELEIRSLAVAPAHRRRGVARRLLAALLASERANGARDVFLEVRRSNAAALGLYRSAGFAPAGERRAYYADGESAIVMAARL
jgi:[ribosomal protein S18]-alanine N-acetyltransferase